MLRERTSDGGTVKHPLLPRTLCGPCDTGPSDSDIQTGKDASVNPYQSGFLFLFKEIEIYTNRSLVLSSYTPTDHFVHDTSSRTCTSHFTDHCCNTLIVLVQVATSIPRYIWWQWRRCLCWGDALRHSKEVRTASKGLVNTIRILPWQAMRITFFPGLNTAGKSGVEKQSGLGAMERGGADDWVLGRTVWAHCIADTSEKVPV